MNFNKATGILTGALCMILGVMIIHDPKMSLGFYQIKSGFNVPVGIAVIILGAFFIWTDVIKPRKENLICPTCEELFRCTESLGDKCPKCRTKLEPLEGFYKRHPELKAKKGQKDKN
jgi:hypothetical protein